MAKSKWFILIFLIIVLIAIIYYLNRPTAFECQDAIGCVTVHPDEPLKIGIFQALTGGPEIIGKTQLNTMKLVFNQHQNQLLGHPIELLVNDEKCSSEGGRISAIRYTADPKVIAVLGPTCSGAAVAATKIISDAGMVIISGAATSPYLTSIGNVKGKDWQPGFYRTISNAANMGKAAAIYAVKVKKIKKAAYIHDGDAFTRGNAEFFAQTIKQLGSEIVFEGVVNKGETNLTPILTAVKNSGADFLFFPIFMPEAMYLVKQSQSISSKQFILMGLVVILNDKFIKFTDKEGVGTLIVSPAPPVNSVKHLQLIEDYKMLYQEVPAAKLFEYAYDAANILYQVLGEVAVKESDGTLHFGRQLLRDTLYGIKDYEGVTGNVISNQFGDMGAPYFDIYQVEDPDLGKKGVESNVVFKLSPKDFK
jgi:branched-chain amino acid transport system substrate-binding protein